MEQHKMEKLTKSLEKYLYTIYKLSIKKDKLTPKDIGEILGFNAASTLDGIKTLQKKEFIEYKPYKGIKLLDKGARYARIIEQRKNTTALFLEKFLLVDKKNMDETVDSIEYHLNDFLLERFNYFIDFLNFCPCSAPRWIEGFKQYLEYGEMTEKCAKCIEYMMENGKKPDCSGCNISV